MSAATVAEPFLLSSYPESSAHRKRKAVPLYASLPSGSGADPFVTVAVQGDGVHVLDTSTLHPAISHTLGPTASFLCPPTTRASQPGSDRTCTSYAVLNSGPEVQAKNKGKTIIAWEELLSGGVSSNTQNQKGKRVAVAPHPVAHLYAPEYLPQKVVVVSTSGAVSIADEELRISATSTPQNAQPSVLVKHFLFPSASCSFLSPHTSSACAAISVSFLRSGDVLRLCTVGTDGESLNALGECVVPIDETDILDISCSHSGFISVLLPSGTWLALALSTSPSSALTISQAAEPLRLHGLTFVNTTRSEATLAALTSSHVLLAAITVGSASEIALLLWDLRYGVLLAQQTISVPSTLPRPKKHGAILQLQASPVLPSQGASRAGTVNLNALLVLLPSPEREMQADTTAPARSTVLVVPVTVPATSTIANAMGKANAGARWISTKATQGQGQGQNLRGLPEMSAAARKTLREMKTAIDGSATASTVAAESVFFEHVKQQSKGKGAAAEETQSDPVEYSFVQGVLELVLRAPAAQNPSTQGKAQNTCAYSPKIVTHLLENRMVTSSMVEGGLLPALAARNDWACNVVSLVMRTVTDLPEDDIVFLLSQAVAAHRQTAADTDTMQVDSPSTSASGPPPLAPFLAQCVTYPHTPALERTALRKHLPDGSDVTAVLTVLDRWLLQHTASSALLPSPTAPTSPPPSTSGSVPPLDKTLAFIQTLLDASLLALLGYPPAHGLLRTLAAHLEPALARTAELEVLCGPLEPFARAARAQEVKEDGGKAAAESGKDWRRKRRLAHEQAGIAVGLYQVEELVL